jgi:deazaflavin-dependent oxidoreductase (nitroreductase family)
MAFSRGLARFNKRVTNRVQGIWAPYLPPWAVIIHKGRLSGRRYRTPVFAWRSGDRLGVVLYYGERSEWLRNVLAAGGAEVRRAGRVWHLSDPRVLDATDPAVRGVVPRLAGGRRVLLGELTD